MENNQVPNFLTGKEEFNNDALKLLKEKVEHLLDLQSKIETATEKLKVLMEAEKRYSGEEIPNLLSQYNLSEIKLASGQKVIVKQDVNITIENDLLFHKFLRKRNDDDIIKTIMEFGRISTEDYDKVVEALDKTDVDYDAADKVHWQTAKKYFKELTGFDLEEDEELDENQISIEELPEWVKIYRYSKTTIKEPKKKRL